MKSNSTEPQPQPNITPAYVLNLTEPTKQFLCPVEANTYGIEFVYFKIRNCENNQTLIEINKHPEDIGKPQTENGRTVKYNFGPMFFVLKMIGTTLKFRVGGQPVKNFKMIERHFFKNKLIKSFQFSCPFCMPNSTNQMQAIYDVPQFTEEEIQDMINSPWQTVSDSFYFVEDKLIMHTKALFSYKSFDE